MNQTLVLFYSAHLTLYSKHGHNSLFVITSSALNAELNNQINYMWFSYAYYEPNSLLGLMISEIL